ncbi:tripartite tricarboxylate transporter TctB family protein [Roseinatronobacter sp.]|uniref:tripartite tricarboxylate transporter TctB family protein n=1 Tax=Roseinatronobacter sp. TaxID=1945755 RepID=UPI0025F2B927|nr:tripartite tricarboxylate transporter TctB family protein [Rhodobaca sp.]
MSEERDQMLTQQAGEIARLLSYVALLAVSISMFLEARTIPTSRFEALGAGAFPMLVHALLSLLLISAIIGAVRRIPTEAYPRFASQVVMWVQARRLVLLMFLCLIVYVTAMPMIGYPITTLIFLLVLLLTLSPRTKAAVALSVVLALVFSYGLNWLFAEVFNVFLPRGR